MKKWLLLFLILCAPAWGAVKFSAQEEDYLIMAVSSDIDVADGDDFSWWGRGIFPATSDANIEIFVDCRDGDENWLIFAGLNNSISDKFYISIKSDNASSITVQSNSSLDDGGEHDWALTYDDSGNATLYIDGTAQTTTASTSALNSITMSDGIYGCGIGREPHAASRYWENGTVKEVAFWNGYLLTAQDIANLHASRMRNMPLQIGSAYLKIYVPFDDFPDASAMDTSSGGYKDRSGHGNNFTGMDGNSDNDSKNVADNLTYP